MAGASLYLTVLDLLRLVGGKELILRSFLKRQQNKSNIFIETVITIVKVWKLKGSTMNRGERGN